MDVVGVLDPDGRARAPRAASSGAATTHVLQPVLFPVDPRTERLYVSERRGSAVFTAAGGLSAAAGDRVAFDAYVNGFYEAHWRAHTDLSAVRLSLRGAGRCRCGLRRIGQDGRTTVLRHEVLSLDGDADVGFEVDLEAGDRAGRLTFELEALDAPFQVRTLAWTSRAPPARAVAIGVALCTFNREAFLARTLERLLAAPAAARIAAIVVVNQGAPLTALPSSPRLRVVEQANFGGAGGFTRGALELLADGAVDHVLFMDDDVELEARHVVTAAAFASRLRRPTIVGGQMLDLYKPTLMFESSTSVTADNLLAANHRDLDLLRPAALDALARPVPCDFNGWWFSLIPAECLREHGLPAPVFIRGDDQEYGVRVGRGGIPTVSLPPVSVWHEPFYAKPPSWQLYYDLRNRLIFASLYPDRFRLDGPVQLFKRLLAMLIRYDYQQTWSIALALRDFLAGPAALDEGALVTHARVVARLAAHAPARLAGPATAGLADDAHPLDRAGGRARLIASFVRLLLGRPARNAAGEGRLVWADMPRDLMRLGRRYVLSDEGEHFHHEMRYSLAATWSRLLATSLAIARYGVSRRRAAAEWRRRMPELITPASWASRLGLAAETPAPGERARQ